MLCDTMLVSILVSITKPFSKLYCYFVPEFMDGIFFMFDSMLLIMVKNLHLTDEANFRKLI